MFYIEDGKGRGYKVGVSVDSRLLTECVTISAEHHVNHSHGEAYHLLYEGAPVDNSYFLYIKNSNNSADLVIEGITFRSASDSVIDVRHVTGTPSAGSEDLSDFLLLRMSAGCKIEQREMEHSHGN